MKKMMLLLFFTGSCYILIGQEIVRENKTRHEIGVNATNFITNFFSPNDLPAFSGNYLLSYRIYRPGKKVLRMGLTLNLDYSEEKSEEEDDTFTKQYNAQFRFGWERQIPITIKWTFLAGLDFLGGYRQDVVNFNDIFFETKIEVKRWNVGSGLFLGLQYNINERIGLFTESTFYARYNNTERINSSDAMEDNNIDKTKSIGLNVTLPTAIYFFVKF